jgi:3-isopropylmalate/(R)-2-methylmalate dehydratase small subunit
VAESFGRIYFRNCIAIAFPNLACPGIRATCRDGDEVAFDLASGEVRNLSRDVALQGRAYTRDLLEIVERGGLMGVLRQRFGLEEQARR